MGYTEYFKGRREAKSDVQTGLAELVSVDPNKVVLVYSVWLINFPEAKLAAKLYLYLPTKYYQTAPGKTHIPRTIF